ncbi:MAG: L-tyrosine/L-tryptophan isonitrile synthase family protein [Candidatus Levybacteria bacterium]|nr:L-tyrosine/L-tryptophan isonitrile synthase family protein [Candidatus Levybacteria bacterium]
MSYSITFAQKVTGQRISSAIPFKYPLDEEIPEVLFPERRIEFKEVISLCEELTPIKYDHSSLVSFLQEDEISIGNKDAVGKEVSKYLKETPGHTISAFLLCLPFKCPVPLKTGFETLPNLGEILFLFRLSKVTKLVSMHTPLTLHITLLEETDALRSVFKVTKNHSDEFKSSLHRILEKIDGNEGVKIRSLAEIVSGTKDNYLKDLGLQIEQMKENIEQFRPSLQAVIPTIALSLQLDKFRLEDQRDFLLELFSKETISEDDYPTLFSTAVGYLSYLEVVNKGIEDSVLKSQLKLSLHGSQKKFGIRATPSTSNILPHHGVPIVSIKNGQKSFEIKYFVDFLKESTVKDPTKICDPDGNFLYFEQKL